GTPRGDTPRRARPLHRCSRATLRELVSHGAHGEVEPAYQSSFAPTWIQSAIRCRSLSENANVESRGMGPPESGGALRSGTYRLVELGVVLPPIGTIPVAATIPW